MPEGGRVMRSLYTRGRQRRTDTGSDRILQQLSGKIIGQPHAMQSIVPYVRMYEAGLNPEGRPAGVFLLLGPTGTGKTRTVEALAEVLHGSRRHHLRVDCGEYQMDHEVAKLIGAPPGYLGHRETHPLLTQARLASVASQESSLSIVLFDEIEKAAPSLTRLLLGVLDKATLRLGDNNVVNFERSLIFLTSNVGARGMQEALGPGIGFGRATAEECEADASRLETIAMRAARRNFSPEFMNRIDAAITYQPLTEKALGEILDIQLTELQEHIEMRLGVRAFRLEVTPRGRRFLLSQGTSAEYGAREIRRALHRLVTQPIANMMADGRVRPGGRIRVDAPAGKSTMQLKAA
jgi:ATP-dependent Clp protease ATP-binding subunit ClpA